MDTDKKEHINCPCGGKYIKWGEHSYWNNKATARHNHTMIHYRYLVKVKREQQEEARNLIQEQFGTVPSKL